MTATQTRRRARPFTVEGPDVVLELPDTRQSATWDCGHAVAACVLQFFNKPVPRAFPASPIDGTDPLSLVPVFRRAGLRVLAGEMDAADLRQQTRAGRPVVCLVRYGGVGHYVVVAGFRGNRVVYHCPTDGVQSEPVGEFLARWWDQARDVRYEKFGISIHDTD